MVGRVLLVNVCMVNPGTGRSHPRETDKLDLITNEQVSPSSSGRDSLTHMYESKPHRQNYDNHLSGIRAMLKSCLERVDYKQSVAKNKREWTLVGKVVDRILFLAYLIALFVLLCMVFSAIYD